MPNDREKIALQLSQEYENGLEYKQGRVANWQRIEDLYFGRVKKTVKGQFNVPLPIMSGFVDTMHSKVDEKTIVRFKEAHESLYRNTKKTQAFWDAESNKDDNDFASKDLNVKKLAIMSGRGIWRVFGESKPKFKFNLRPVDHYDFYIDPMTRGGVENARYLGEAGIWLSRQQLIDGANDGMYDAKAVDTLINGQSEDTIKDNDDKYRNKANRLNALGLTGTMFNFQGEGMTQFIESGTTYKGKRMYALWNYETKLIIRLEEWDKVFESGMWAWKSWATHEDEFNFWSKGPCDDILPVAESIAVLFNQELTNRNRRNMGQRAYDPEMFPNAALLEFRPDGLVPTAAGATKTRQIASGIYQFETPELQGTINLVEYMDNMLGTKSGITAGSQGAAEEQKVGIYQGNLQQIADRLGLVNKSYTKCWRAIARAFVWACKEHLNEQMAVRLIGENGVEWDYLRGRDIDPNVDILVESGSAELEVALVKKQSRSNALAALNADPALLAVVNPKWRAEQTLLAGDFTDEEVRVAMDTETTGNKTVMARASEAINDIVAGKTPKLFRGANTAFQQKIVDFALDNTDDNLDLYMALMTYSEAHDAIVEENMVREAMRRRSQTGLPPEEAVPMPVSPAPKPPLNPAMALA
jgi:hypothetical protein